MEAGRIIAGSPNHWMGNMVMGFTAMMLEVISTVMNRATTIMNEPVNRITASRLVSATPELFDDGKKGRGYCPGPWYSTETSVWMPPRTL